MSAGPACLTCKGICPGFQPHSWRKACTQCHCSEEDHVSGSDSEHDLKLGRLLSESRYAHLTVRLKGGDGTRVYKRNRMIVTNPVVSRKDPTFNTVTYDWVPPGLTQKLAMQYMDLLAEDRRPVSGTAGSVYRHRQLMRQLPAYDQDPARCHSLSEAEVKAMSEFVRAYKQESLGVGEVVLPGEKCSATKSENASEDQPDQESSANGGDLTLLSSECRCGVCGQPVVRDQTAVCVERDGHTRLYHPACFVCSECGEALVDLIYFWSDGRLLCGRHYCQSHRPRCLGCDELIFCETFVQESSGCVWHTDHFCCWLCGQSITDQCGCDKRLQK